MADMSDYLFAQPSFLSGMARAFDLWGQFDSYNDSPTPDLADQRALYSDWLALGIDFKAAIAEELGQTEAA
jgi:hypothetical protein